MPQTQHEVMLAQHAMSLGFILNPKAAARACVLDLPSRYGGQIADRRIQWGGKWCNAYQASAGCIKRQGANTAPGVLLDSHSQTT